MKKTFTIIIMLVVLTLFGCTQKAHAQTSQEILSKLQSALTELDTLKLKILELQKQYLANVASGTGNTSSSATTQSFTKEMGLGETSEDIKRLQQFLGKDKEVYPDGRVTGYFGPLTAEAVLAFQKKHGIAGANGHVGPKTLAKLNELISNTSSTPATPSTTTPVPITTVPSNTNTSTPTQNTIKAIKAEVKNKRTSVTVDYTSGNDDSFMLNLFNKGDIIDELSSRLKLSESKIKDILSFEDKSTIKEIVVILGKNDAKAHVKYSSADTTTYEFDTDDEDDIVEELADKLKMDEDDVEDLVDFEDDKGDIEEITVKLEDNKANILVEYEDGDYESFSFDTSNKNKIIEELSDRLNISEKDVEKITEFKGGYEIVKIKVEIGKDKTYVTVDYKGKQDETFTLSDDEEDDIIEELADRLDMSEDDIEDLIEWED